jgi:hypothetical protein
MESASFKDPRQQKMAEYKTDDLKIKVRCIYSETSTLLSSKAAKLGDHMHKTPRSTGAVFKEAANEAGGSKPKKACLPLLQHTCTGF